MTARRVVWHGVAVLVVAVCMFLGALGAVHAGEPSGWAFGGAVGERVEFGPPPGEYQPAFCPVGAGPPDPGLDPSCVVLTGYAAYDRGSGFWCDPVMFGLSETVADGYCYWRDMDDEDPPPGDDEGETDALNWSNPAHVGQVLLWAVLVGLGFHGFGTGARP